jgi:hypothetical protein
VVEQGTKVMASVPLLKPTIQKMRAPVKAKRRNMNAYNELIYTAMELSPAKYGSLPTLLMPKYGCGGVFSIKYAATVFTLHLRYMQESFHTLSRAVRTSPL